jgi:hypothetical protein
MKTDLQLITPRGGQLFDVAKIERAIGNMRSGTAKDIAVDFDVTQQTFRRKNEVQINEKGNNQADIFISDPIYYFLNFGTRVRYATMSDDWQSKTVPRLIASRQGSGRVLYVRTDRPRPGIKARHFDEEIAKKWNKLLPGIVERMILAEL